MQLRPVSGHSMQPGCAIFSPPNLRLTPSVEKCQFVSVNGGVTVRGLRFRSRRTKALHTPISAHPGAAAPSKVDIDMPYKLRDSDKHFYSSTGFVKLKDVFDGDTLSHYAPAMSLEVRQADKTPRQLDPDYQQAFTQVPHLPSQSISFASARSVCCRVFTSACAFTGAELTEAERYGCEVCDGPEAGTHCC